METVLPDILAPRLSVVFCGINPGIVAATTGHHFAGRGNRFWRILHLAGFTPEEITPAQAHTILQYGYGLTTVVERATARADQLSAEDFQAAAGRFERKMEDFAPRCLAFLGKAAYAALMGQRDIAWGLQPDPFGGAVAWVLPNPSGRNRAFSVAQLIDAYRPLLLAANRTS